MTNPAEGAKDLLVAAGVGTFGATTGWAIFIGERQEKPDTAVTVYNSGGREPFVKWLVDQPSLQVIVRGKAGGYQAVYNKAVDVFNVLHSLPSQDLNGDRWVSVVGRGGIVQIGKDENSRPLLSMNFDLIIEPATGTHRQPL